MPYKWAYLLTHGPETGTSFVITVSLASVMGITDVIYHRHTRVASPSTYV